MCVNSVGIEIITQDSWLSSRLTLGINHKNALSLPHALLVWWGGEYEKQVNPMGWDQNSLRLQIQ